MALGVGLCRDVSVDGRGRQSANETEVGGGESGCMKKKIKG